VRADRQGDEVIPDNHIRCASALVAPGVVSRADWRTGMYVLTVTNFADTCTGRSDTVSVYDSYEDAHAAAGRTAAVDNLTVDTQHRSRTGADVVRARGVFVDGEGVALFGFRITCAS
jgi:hypothetical protein